MAFAPDTHFTFQGMAAVNARKAERELRDKERQARDCIAVYEPPYVALSDPTLIRAIGYGLVILSFLLLFAALPAQAKTPPVCPNGSNDLVARMCAGELKPLKFIASTAAPTAG